MLENRISNKTLTQRIRKPNPKNHDYSRTNAQVLECLNVLDLYDEMRFIALELSFLPLAFIDLWHSASASLFSVSSSNVFYLRFLDVGCNR